MGGRGTALVFDYTDTHTRACTHAHTHTHTHTHLDFGILLKMFTFEPTSMCQQLPFYFLTNYTKHEETNVN